MYRIVLARTAKKDIASLDKKQKTRVIAALLDLRKDPYMGKKLKGKLRNYYSLRVLPYRIIYGIDKPDKTIFIIRIGHRRGVYQ